MNFSGLAMANLKLDVSYGWSSNPSTTPAQGQSYSGSGQGKMAHLKHAATNFGLKVFAI